MKQLFLIIPFLFLIACGPLVNRDNPYDPKASNFTTTTNSSTNTTKTSTVSTNTVTTISTNGTNYVVSTFAGSGTAAFANGNGTLASFNTPTAITLDSVGNLFVADSGNHRIRKITSAGIVSSLAGSGTAAYVDGSGTGASFTTPDGLAIDSTGFLFVAEWGSHRIRKVSSAGNVTTFAGSGTGSFANGTGTLASFNAPYGLCIDATDILFVADSANHRLRKVTSTGVVTTIAGSGTGAYLDGTGTGANFFNNNGVCIDSLGNLFVADSGNHRIRKVTSSGEVTTFAGSGAASFSDGIGTVAIFNSPYGICVDGSGNLLVSDTYNNRIRKITSSGTVTTLAGSGTGTYSDGIGTAASFNLPIGIAIDSTGIIFIADYNNNRIRKITLTYVTATNSFTTISTN